MEPKTLLRNVLRKLAGAPHFTQLCDRDMNIIDGMHSHDEQTIIKEHLRNKEGAHVAIETVLVVG
jgi:hypothetical protein